MIRRGQARALVSTHFDALGMGGRFASTMKSMKLDLAIQQKIEIARAIFSRSPRVLLLDEPTSTLFRTRRLIGWATSSPRVHSQGANHPLYLPPPARGPRLLRYDGRFSAQRQAHRQPGRSPPNPDDEVIRMIAGAGRSRHAFSPARRHGRVSAPEVLAAERISTTGKLRERLIQPAALERSLASPAFRAWVNSTSSSPVSAWPDLTGGSLRVDGETDRDHPRRPTQLRANIGNQPRP